MRYVRLVLIGVVALVAASLAATPSQAEDPPVPNMDGESVFVPPDLGGEPGEPGEPLPAPSRYQTSEYLAGSIVYSLVFVESSGGAGNCSPADPQSENWSAYRRTQVLNEINAGIGFWATRSNGPSRSFILDNLGVRTTSCEPIARPSTDRGKWIADVLTGMGYYVTPSTYFDVTRSFADDRRDARGADWGFVIFVVDSANDPDGEFSDEKFALAYLNGPFMVMTYDNDNWGISDMNLVTAHETGHIFGALDEYVSSNCSTAESYGYLNAANTSCNNGGITSDVSIMGEWWEQVAPNVDVSTSARKAVGWRNPAVGDSGKLVVDVVRTAAASTHEYWPDPTSDTTPTCGASASNPPFPPEGPRIYKGVNYGTAWPVNISRVEGAEWNVDGGGFTAVDQPDDGAFDEEWESYHFTPSTPLAAGTHIFGTRSINDFGHISNPDYDWLTIVLPDSDGDGFSDEAETYMGTDPLDNCPDDNQDDAWPPDTNMDRSVNVLDVFPMFPHWLLPVGPGGARFDLNVDGFVNILDVFQMEPYWMGTCT